MGESIEKSRDVYKVVRGLEDLTLFLRGGVNLTPPVVFLHISKIFGLRQLKYSDFSYIPKALPLGLKPGFNTNCLSPQAH